MLLEHLTHGETIGQHANGVPLKLLHTPSTRLKSISTITLPKSKIYSIVLS